VSRISFALFASPRPVNYQHSLHEVKIMTRGNILAGTLGKESTQTISALVSKCSFAARQHGCSTGYSTAWIFQNPRLYRYPHGFTGCQHPPPPIPSSEILHSEVSIRPLPVCCPRFSVFRSFYSAFWNYHHAPWDEFKNQNRSVLPALPALP